MQCSWSKVSFTEHCAWPNQVGGSYVEDFARNLAENKLTIPAARDALAAAGVTLELVIAEHLNCGDPAGTCEALRRDMSAGSRASSPGSATARRWPSGKTSLPRHSRVVYSTGFSASSITSPMAVDGVHPSQSFCWFWFFGLASRMSWSM